jgi:hypothetical protein
MEPIDASTAPQPTPAKHAGAGEARLWEKGNFSFGDILDAINPLQHIPVISTLYRAITGDEIGTAPRLVGDLLFGGPIGFMAGVLSVGIKDQTGKDPGEQVLAMLDAPFAGDTAAAPVVAAAAPAAPAPPLAENAKVSAEPASDAPATPARRLGVDVKPDHPPMPLIRSSGGAVAAPQTALVPLQTATVIPRPPAFAAPAAPVDVPRQMMDALDKYARMQTTRGAHVDLAN